MAQLVRHLMRCTVCRVQWSVENDLFAKCACGGRLEHIDLETEINKLPYSPFDPNKK